MITRETPQRVSILSPYAPSIVSFRGPLIREMVRCGVEVYVLAPDYTPEIREAVAQLGALPVDYPLDRTGTNPARDLYTVYRLASLLRSLRPDGVMAYNIKPVIYGTIAASLVGIPQRIALIEGLGYTFIETPSASFKQRVTRGLVKVLYRVALKRAQRVLFLNPDDLNEFVQMGLVEPSKAILLGGIGVDLEEWQPSPPFLEPVTFTLAARLLREKGIVEFAEAARVIKARYPNTRFLLLGGLDTNPGALTQQQVEAWVQQGILEWLGHVPDVRPYFAQTSVYVLPSYREGVPRSTQEAMAMARPVITTDAPGCRETVVHGVNGFLVPPRDANALAEAMEQFIRQPDLIITMGQASRRLAEERFDARQINARLCALLLGVQSEAKR
ncbi:Glycosyltransferase involved in cell wall bisynthesis [Armatimonadetes bacterium GBS]|jgi:glycosyltransferase involved in cell wall biosynthesis|nr:Glycosyltransferase involved in cell wall bisynthesis [Armatimonadetes bacterium GBS]CUU36597.1 Glycosyltransferase involved in cell wall bisynthesis [Armatimonadetes bacterium GXS]